MPQIHKGEGEGESIELEDPVVDYYNQLVAEEEEFVLPIISEMENMRLRMKLDDCRVVMVKYDVFAGWVNGAARTLKHIGDIVQK